MQVENKFVKGYVATIVWLVLTAQGICQEADTARVIVEDGWIEDMNQKLAINLAFTNQREVFKVDGDPNDMVLYPNTEHSAKIGVHYKFLTLGFKFAPGFFPGNGDEDIKGDTKNSSFGITLNLKNLVQNATYSRVRGFYLRNTADYQAWQPGDPYIQFPDLVYTGLSGYSAWKFNSRFSLKSLFSPTERQLKSAGSFIPVLFYRYYVIDDKVEIGPGQATQKSNNFEFNLSAGYHYTYVLKEKFFASLRLSPGIGMIHTKLTTRFTEGDVRSHQNNFIFRWDTEAGIGYNGRDYYTGAYMTTSGASYRQDGTAIVNHNTRLFYGLYFGIRIDAPRWLRSATQSVESVLD